MNHQPDPLLLAEFALFNGLTNEQLCALSADLHPVTCPSGTNIMAVEQPGEVMYLIIEGAVKVSVPQMDGSGVILSILGPGETVGEMSLLDAAGRSATVVTLQETVFLWISREALRGWIQRTPALSDNLMRILSGRLRRANEQIAALATLSVHGRVARTILTLAQDYGAAAPRGGVRVPFCLTQSDIGAMVGASRERVNAVMRTYKRHRQISVDGGHRITIHDPEALARGSRA